MKPALAGFIGYVSADFTEPYAKTVKGNPAPLSASVQNYDQISLGKYHPNQVKFVAPAPAGADAAFASLGTVATTNDYPGWDLYAQAYPATKKLGSIPIGKMLGAGVPVSILGVPNTGSAYPISGTTFAYVYSCYASS